jgi:hypothetical protein
MVALCLRGDKEGTGRTTSSRAMVATLARDEESRFVEHHSTEVNFSR